MLNKILNQAVKQAVSGINVTIEELIALRSEIIHDRLLTKNKSQELIVGQHARVRGRGIEFDSTHEYQSGDDIRHMAWRITARSLTPHVKVYQEEKERSVWLAIDLSPSLYFGTRCMFKSVKIIKQAAYLGWSHLHEKIGASIATPNQVLTYHPQRREKDFLSMLKSFAAFSMQTPKFTENNCLHALLSTMQQHIRSGNLIFLLSDFSQFDDEDKKLILHYSERAQIKLVFVYDPFEVVAPPENQYVVTDGRNTVLFNTRPKQHREQYQQQFKHKLNDLIEFSRRYNIGFQALCTDPSQEDLIKS